MTDKYDETISFTIINDDIYNTKYIIKFTDEYVRITSEG
jgi:hypothetical protein